MSAFAKLFDHTLLRANATAEEIARLCTETRSYGFYGACVNPYYVAPVVRALDGSAAVAIAVVGFPLGANTMATKVEETRRVLGEGAAEIDMVVNLGAYLSGDKAYVRRELQAIVEAAAGHPVKAIIETAYLNSAQIGELCRWAAAAGVAFVKTSTGFSPRGASVADVATIKEALRDSPETRIKASGGIKTLEAVEALVAAGASRIGSSASVAILSEHERKNSTYHNQK